MRWLIFSRLFFTAYLAMYHDDRWGEIAVAFILTLVSCLAIARVIGHVIARDSELGEQVTAVSMFVLVFLDLPLQVRMLLCPSSATARVAGKDRILE